MNPLLQDSNHPFEAINFNEIKEEHFLPALKEAIKEAKENLEKIKKETNTTFENIIIKEECSADRLDEVVNVFYALYSAHCTEGLSKISEEFNQILTEYTSDISLDADLFAKIKEVYDKKSELNLTKEQEMVLENSYKGYTRNGALLNNEDKEKLREIDQRLSKLSHNFSENVRNATNDFLLVIKDEARLSGLPEGAKEAAKEKAEEKGYKEGWAFTLDFPSYYPVLQYCEDRELRAEIFKASSTRATQGKFDNRQIVLDTIKARSERAKLLGYEDHPAFVLENRMAKEKNTVFKFIEEISEKALPKAKEDLERLKDLKEELSGDRDLRRYDFAYYSEKLKKRELDFDDEVLRPYFKLENVLNGIFEVAKRLYGIEFKERKDIPKYHEDVITYEVVDAENNFVGLFYGDYFPRAEKRPGAWMTTFRNGGLQFGEVKRPFVCNVCNFTKPTKSKPSLLTLNEVLTLFHEFGHGLHGLLTKTNYRSVAGASVLWDFVELPSQIMENWVMEKECLDLFARHYETNEQIPSDLIEKIKKNQQFLEGLATIRQMSFATLDMSWHTVNPDNVTDVLEFEDKAMENLSLFPAEEGTNMSCSFGHIFSGGYSSGYYSYKWAEVLDADAFSYFKDHGIFNDEIAKSFKENILEKGGSEDPMELYKKFRGQEPSPDALLKRGGLI